MGHGMVVLLVMATLGQSGLNVEVLDQYLFAAPDAGQVRWALTKSRACPGQNWAFIAWQVHFKPWGGHYPNPPGQWR